MSQTATLTPARVARQIGALYGVACYVFFLATFLYSVGWVTNLVVPASINAPASTMPWGSALMINLALLGMFGLQHSGMARAGFKRWWTRIIPAPLERQTYVLATNVCFWLLFAFWQPMTGVVWSVENPLGWWALTGAGALGWLLVLCATFMINHFDLFGLRQTWYQWKNQPYPDLGFRVVFLYHWVRHPIQLGFLIAFWFTPHMTVGHLLFAGVCTAYILVALQLEERDLIRSFGEKYQAYRAQVGMLCPARKYKG